MAFCEHFNKQTNELEIYNILEDEMSKYKTLNHEKIQWNLVYQSSLEILTSHSLDMKICNYFTLACLHLNQVEYFNQLLEFLVFLNKIFKSDSENLEESRFAITNQKKRFIAAMKNFVDEVNKSDFHLAKTEEFNAVFKELGAILECSFPELKNTSSTPTNNQENKSITNQTHHANTKEININSLDDREYRIFCEKITLELLENDLDNPNAYAMFFEAMWGRIHSLPPNNNNITHIRYPDSHLIRLLKNDNENYPEQIKFFVKNLILQPFWIDGLQIFCEVLEKNHKENLCKTFKLSVNSFLKKFQNLKNLKFQNGENLCSNSALQYFAKDLYSDKETQPKSKKKQSKLSIEQHLLQLNKENSDNSLYSNLNAFMEMSQLFEENQMNQNAKAIYSYLVDKMENTLLKDYLKEYYLSIQQKLKKD
ncbi:type VI secretion system domain-containing protein [Helicobacter sp. MIT 05-5294]|uniref:type VI secretion system domain-containing protein n=1 Tax=Helicobacter sp. MIT 05-5294 TaxID=1548150 RepID=UPI00051F8A32|nr:type VI secretion system domain-containing protein [Helicobacter sp. MIT 05-5294]TLD86758.1 nucleobase:cation symporter [Helicobacter sp. MIT 05-5294]